MMNITVADNPSIDMKYDDALNIRLDAFPRERTPNIDYAALLPYGDTILSAIAPENTPTDNRQTIATPDDQAMGAGRADLSRRRVSRI